MVDGKLMDAILENENSDSLGDERKIALQAKFTNPDCKDVLLATKNAVLQHFVDGKRLEEDTLLMEVREKIKQEEKKE